MKLTIALCLFAAACGSSESSSSSSSSKGGDSAPAIDLAGVNALVPPELKDKLVFEQQDVIEDRRHPVTYTLAAPKGWKQGMKGFAKLKGDDWAGFITELGVGSNCDGSCEPKDWNNVADKVEFSQFDNRGKVIKNEVTPTSRLLIVDVDDKTYVRYAWWTDAASRYHTCSATLEAPVKAAAPAFAKAAQLAVGYKNETRRRCSTSGAAAGGGKSQTSSLVVARHRSSHLVHVGPAGSIGLEVHDDQGAAVARPRSAHLDRRRGRRRRARPRSPQRTRSLTSWSRGQFHRRSARAGSRAGRTRPLRCGPRSWRDTFRASHRGELGAASPAASSACSRSRSRSPAPRSRSPRNSSRQSAVALHVPLLMVGGSIVKLVRPVIVSVA